MEFWHIEGPSSSIILETRQASLKTEQLETKGRRKIKEQRTPDTLISVLKSAADMFLSYLERKEP